MSGLRSTDTHGTTAAPASSSCQRPRTRGNPTRLLALSHIMQRHRKGSSASVSSSGSETTVISTPPPQARRDDEFYSRDVIFQVEGVLFKVPRRPFEQESAFKDTFSLPSPNGEEGLTDDNPIYLEGVTEEEFRPLLWVMLRPAYGAGRVLTTENWTHVLKLSTMWSFDSIREKAIEELTRLVRAPVQRIALAREFHVPNWIEPALLSLAQADALSAGDLQQLGWDTAAKLFVVRESVGFTNACACACNYCTGSHGPVAQPGVPLHHAPGMRPAVVTAASVRRAYDFTQKIREVFGTELY
ncbi:hypothetical protein C8T65DRAFT_662692 [Cerioporus squamosus]|nr:hypothetical protein C8T65DRAFT_662692 [Cerioporus squamosus]